MTYQEILKAHLNRRTNMNPRYSLRAFAGLLGLSPSKMSEILSGQKGLSLARAEDICTRLKLKNHETEIFLLSVQAQHSRVKKLKDEAHKKLKELAQAELSEKHKTQQRNAWYFGAYKAVKETALKIPALQKSLGLTSLQLENAERFIKRIQRLHPDLKKIAFEPASVFKNSLKTMLRILYF